MALQESRETGQQDVLPQKFRCVDAHGPDRSLSFSRAVRSKTCICASARSAGASRVLPGRCQVIAVAVRAEELDLHATSSASIRRETVEGLTPSWRDAALSDRALATARKNFRSFQSMRLSILGKSDCGESSGPIPPLNVALLGAKGSLYVTRPSIAHYTANRAEYEAAAQNLFAAMEARVLRASSVTSYALSDARKAHEDLEARRTTGSVVLVPMNALRQESLAICNGVHDEGRWQKVS
jgi:hypothetical protein